MLMSPVPLRELSLLVGITGASGVIYGCRFVEEYVRGGGRVDLIASEGARRVFEAELGWCAGEEGDAAGGTNDTTALLLAWLKLSAEEQSRIRVFAPGDIAALPASGTYRTRGMVIVPASMKTCAAIAHGYADNLITRAADVMLKERRPLVVVPRETPLSAIHLENLLTLSRAGAVILPAMPGFYAAPRTLEQLVDFVVMKIFDALDIPHDFPHTWKPGR